MLYHSSTARVKGAHFHFRFDFVILDYLLMHIFQCIQFVHSSQKCFYFVQVTFVVLGWLVEADPQTKKTHYTTEVKLNWTYRANLIITLFNYPVQRKPVFKLAQLVPG